MASQITYIDQINPFPDEIENLYHQLFPLEQTDLKSYTFNPIQISTFRINRRDGIQFCMKRIHGNNVKMGWLGSHCSFQTVEIFLKSVSRIMTNGEAFDMQIFVVFMKFFQQKHLVISPLYSFTTSIHVLTHLWTSKTP